MRIMAEKERMMVPLQIMEVHNGFKQIWQADYIGEFREENNDGCGDTTLRLHIISGNKEWRILISDKHLKGSGIFMDKAACKEFDLTFIDTIEFNGKQVSLNEYMCSWIDFIFIEDVYQFPFLEETKEIFKIVEHGEWRWTVTPDSFLEKSGDEYHGAS